MAFPFLSFPQLSDSSAKVLIWLTNINTAGGTHIAFYKSCRAQGLDRKMLPYCGYFQPYVTCIALLFGTVVVFVYGYPTVKSGNFTVESFSTYHATLVMGPALFLSW